VLKSKLAAFAGIAALTACPGGSFLADCEPACRSGYVCDGGECIADDTCEPACRSGYMCMGGTCVAQGSAGGGERELLDLPDVSMGGDTFADIALDVPSGVTSFYVTATSKQTSDLTGLMQMTAPNGSTLYANGQGGSLFRPYPTAGRFSLLFPNTPHLTIQPGRYQLRFATNADFVVPWEVHALFKRDRRSGGTIQANLYFVGVPNINAASAAQDQQCQWILSELQRIYRDAGIEIGNFRYIDATPEQAQRLGVINSIEGAGNELEQLVAIADGDSQNEGFNFLLVNSIEVGNDGLVILGIAGGIPGRVSVRGKTHGGVAVSFGGYREQPETVVTVMAHEAGHYLGLFHTSEQDGSESDPLDDTPICDTSRDADRNGIVTAEECAGLGTDNMMFWFANPGTKHFSRDQSFVLNHNPAVR
jgi:hypothetical protein